MRLPLLLALLCLACGPMPGVSRPASKQAERPPAAWPDPVPYCQRPAPMPACANGCPEASDCIEGQCVPLWEADGGHRCIPADRPAVLCQGNSAHHGVFVDGRQVRYLSVLMPAALSALGRAAWRVYDASPDVRPRAWLDNVSLSYWFSSVLDCEKGSVSRYERADLLSSPEAVNWSLYLLVADGGGGPREVLP